MIDTTGIQHVTLPVRDLQEAVAFYTAVMGLSVVERPDFEFPGAWLQAGASQVHLTPARDGDQPNRRQHFALEVRDVEACAVALEADGVEVQRLPHVPGAGRQVFLRDPTGNVIELNQPDR